MKHIIAFLLGLFLLSYTPAFATVNQATVSVTDSGNGSTTAFAYGFIVPFQADGITPAVSVFTTDSSGNITTLMPNQYTIAGVANPAGGTVTYPLSGSPLPSGSTITITRALAYIQPTAVSNQSFYPHTVEQVADNLDMQIQQLAAKTGSLLTGSGVTGQCAQWSSAGSLTASGAACGGGGGGCPTTVMGLTLGCALDATMLSGTPTNGDCAQLLYDPGVLPSIAIADAGQACAVSYTPPCGPGSSSGFSCNFPLTNFFFSPTPATITPGTIEEVGFIDPLNYSGNFPWCGSGSGATCIAYSSSWQCMATIEISGGSGITALYAEITGQDLTTLPVTSAVTLPNQVKFNSFPFANNDVTFTVGELDIGQCSTAVSCLGALHKIHVYVETSGTGTAQGKALIACRYINY